MLHSFNQSNFSSTLIHYIIVTIFHIGGGVHIEFFTIWLCMKGKKTYLQIIKAAFTITHIMDWCHDDGNEKLSPGIYTHKKEESNKEKANSWKAEKQREYTAYKCTRELFIQSIYLYFFYIKMVKT